MGIGAHKIGCLSRRPPTSAAISARPAAAAMIDIEDVRLECKDKDKESVPSCSEHSSSDSDSDHSSDSSSSDSSSRHLPPLKRRPRVNLHSPRRKTARQRSESLERPPGRWHRSAIATPY
ncbi:hypothetical protein AK812_SmicGene42051 [Symbiodinium microadriaticum]|uniref:Uncharacterized protein n=1 Tax=Symbiodinium microadriaticum TaxID=2951 RepID=A0A1Q9C4J3_SYMMI|nr:hypothetical protein AK812_SmicGene42051 [Symbiodinium microadriaticum]